MLRYSGSFIWMLVAFAVIVAMTLVSACGDESGGATSGATTEIEVIKSTPSFGDFPMHVAEKVTGPNHGITIEEQEFEGAVAGRAFAGGAGDFSISGIDKPVLAATEKLFDPLLNQFDNELEYAVRHRPVGPKPRSTDEFAEWC